MQHILVWPDETTTHRAASAFAHALEQQLTTLSQRGFSFWLTGELGTGKTTFVRAVLRQLGVTGPVKSPTYALVEPYALSRLNFYHFDFYRFTSPEEFDNSGFREHFGAGNCCAVEWPERAAGFLPPPDVILALNLQPAGRYVDARANSDMGVACLQAMNDKL